MTFQSVLYERETEASDRARPCPEYFRDLNMDQILDAITAGYEEYDLKPFFYSPLATPGAIEYRHDVLRDLEDTRTFECITSFTGAMRLMREQAALVQRLEHKYQKNRWFLQAVETYCAAICRFSDDLAKLRLNSRAFVAFRDYVRSYVHSKGFASLLATSQKLTHELDRIGYSILIKGNTVTVRGYDSEPDYSADVIETFRRFAQGEESEYKFKSSDRIEMNHVEARILEFVAALNPEIFSNLDGFFAGNQAFADPLLARFDREVHFYIAYLELVDKLKGRGLSFCYPAVSTTDKAVSSEDGFDLALAIAFTKTDKSIVCNDFYLKGKERILIVTGPNQGGKTTFARTFGQLHHLGAIGCLVPGTAARLLLFDRIYTHFERGENLEDRRGKLQDDLIRVHDIVQESTSHSIIIINEIFSSTTLRDAIGLAQKVIERLAEMDLLCVCVTFLDELASYNERTVSMVSTVAPDDPNVRTYKIVRRPADGRSFALSIAEKYELTHDRVKARIPS